MNKEIKEIVILGSIVALILMSSFFAMAGHDDIMNEVVMNKEETDVESIEDLKDNEPKVDDIIVVEEELSVDSVTGLLIGLDADGGLTDVLMAGNFNTVTNEVKIVSIPRDLEVDFRNEPFKTIKNNINSRDQDPDTGKNITKLFVSYCQVNEIYYDLGKTDEAFYDVKTVVEEITGLKIDYIAVIDVSGFREVVDAVGGVDFDVPQRMYYNDPAQDLHIDLQAGMQHLDGEHAMQLVRYRKYRLGDIQRIQVQQDFIVELYKKMSTIRDFDQIIDLSTSIYNIFESDFGLTVALEYAEYVFDLEVKDLLNAENMVTIPSWGELIDDNWHQYWDQDEARKVVEELMNK